MARRLLTQPNADLEVQDESARQAGLSWAEWARRALREKAKAEQEQPAEYTVRDTLTA